MITVGPNDWPKFPPKLQATISIPALETSIILRFKLMKFQNLNTSLSEFLNFTL